MVERQSGLPKQDSVVQPTRGTFNVSLSQKLGIVSVPLIGALGIAFGLFDLEGGIVFQSSAIEAGVSIGVILSAAIIVARISAKSFLVTGSRNLLLLGLAVFEFGVASTVGGIVRNNSLDAGLQIYVLGALVSACLHMVTGIWTYKGSPRVTTRLVFRVWFSYIAAMCFVLLLSILALDSGLFASIGQIGGLPQRLLIGSIFTMLLISGSLFSRVYLRTRNPILFWYSLAVITVAFAFAAFFTTHAEGDLALWTGIGGLCLASLYFVKSAFVSPRKEGTSPQAGRRRTA